MAFLSMLAGGCFDFAALRNGAGDPDLAAAPDDCGAGHDAARPRAPADLATRTESPDLAIARVSCDLCTAPPDLTMSPPPDLTMSPPPDLFDCMMADCPNRYSCKGPKCLLDPGEPCTVNAECFSNWCKMGFCK